MATENTRDAKIAPTAHYTAYVWHRLGMPHADLFVTPTGRRLFWGLRGAGEWLAAAHPRLPSMPQYLELRHRGIERCLDREEPDCIVEIGAGLSRRGVTWAVDRGVRYVELDLRHMIRAKEQILRDARRPRLREALDTGRLRLTVGDVLGEPFADELAEFLRGAERPVVVAEGLLGYFPMDERRAIARAVAEALGRGKGGLFVCDLRAAEGGAGVAAAAKVLKAGIRIVTRGRGAREDFPSHDAIEAYFRDVGFTESDRVPSNAFPHLAHVTSPAAIWYARVG